jgi:hypothetical protein
MKQIPSTIYIFFFLFFFFLVTGEEENLHRLYLRRVIAGRTARRDEPSRTNPAGINSHRLAVPAALTRRKREDAPGSGTPACEGFDAGTSLRYYHIAYLLKTSPRMCHHRMNTEHLWPTIRTPSTILV